MNPIATKHNIFNYISLNNGVKMPIIGFGVYLKGDDCVESVKNPIQFGYRHIDAAQFYENEKEVGEGIRSSGIPRNEIFVITKVMTNGYDMRQPKKV